jgi:hypothetical protein
MKYAKMQNKINVILIRMIWIGFDSHQNSKTLIQYTLVFAYKSVPYLSHIYVDHNNYRITFSGSVQAHPVEIRDSSRTRGIDLTRYGYIRIDGYSLLYDHSSLCKYSKRWCSAMSNVFSRVHSVMITEYKFDRSSFGLWKMYLFYIFEIDNYIYRVGTFQADRIYYRIHC